MILAGRLHPLEKGTMSISGPARRKRLQKRSFQAGSRGGVQYCVCAWEFLFRLLHYSRFHPQIYLKEIVAGGEQRRSPKGRSHFRSNRKRPMIQRRWREVSDLRLVW